MQRRNSDDLHASFWSAQSLTAEETDLVYEEGCTLRGLCVPEPDAPNEIHVAIPTGCITASRFSGRRIARRAAVRSRIASTLLLAHHGSDSRETDAARAYQE